MCWSPTRELPSTRSVREVEKRLRDARLPVMSIEELHRQGDRPDRRARTAGIHRPNRCRSAVSRRQRNRRRPAGEELMPQMLSRRSAVNLDDLLIAREERAARQAAAVAEFAAPLVSITMVIPGPSKDGWLPRRLMEVALNG